MRELGLLNLQKSNLLKGCYAEKRVDLFHVALEFKSKTTRRAITERKILTQCKKGQFWILELSYSGQDLLVKSATSLEAFSQKTMATCQGCYKRNCWGEEGPAKR